MLTHKEVAIKATKFAQRIFGCPIGAWEFCGGWNKEKCDGFIVNSRFSFLIEAKVSRQDFKKDAQKDFRKNENQGVGDFRLYACPKGLLSLEELPEKWGLIEIDEENRNKCTLSFRPTKNELLDFWKYQEDTFWNYVERGRGYEYEIYEFTANQWRFTNTDRKFEVDKRLERAYIFSLATRYKRQKFMENML